MIKLLKYSNINNYIIYIVDNKKKIYNLIY